MATKIQRIIVEFQYIYEENGPSEDDKPLEEGSELADYISEEAFLGNLFVRKIVEEDYKGTDDNDYQPIVK